MNPYFYSIEMLVQQWVAGSQRKSSPWVRWTLEELAEEENQ